jgi:hypothetical protein
MAGTLNQPPGCCTQPFRIRVTRHEAIRNRVFHANPDADHCRPGRSACHEGHERPLRVQLVQRVGSGLSSSTVGPEQASPRRRQRRQAECCLVTLCRVRTVQSPGDYLSAQAVRRFTGHPRFSPQLELLEACGFSDDWRLARERELTRQLSCTPNRRYFCRRRVGLDTRFRLRPEVSLLSRFAFDATCCRYR